MERDKSCVKTTNNCCNVNYLPTILCHLVVWVVLSDVLVNAVQSQLACWGRIDGLGDERRVRERRLGVS